MLALLLLLGSNLLTGGDASASMACTSIASVHTREVLGPISGPEAVVAFLRIYSEDDHAKNTHWCNATYQLVLLSPSGKSADIIYLLSSDGDWNRRLAVHLDGFSKDGKWIFGAISEFGGLNTVFSYNRASRQSSLLNLKDAERTLKSAKCGTNFSVAGTTATGSIVFEPRTTDQCREKNRWILDPSKGKPEPLKHGQAFEILYGTSNMQ